MRHVLLSLLVLIAFLGATAQGSGRTGLSQPPAATSSMRYRDDVMPNSTGASDTRSSWRTGMIIGAAFGAVFGAIIVPQTSAQIDNSQNRGGPTISVVTVIESVLGFAVIGGLLGSLFHPTRP